MSPSSLDALRTTWKQFSTRNNWALVTDEESFLRHAKEEMNSLQDIRSPEQRMRMALMRAYSTVLHEQLQRRNEQAVQEVWLASYRYALRDRFSKDDAEGLAQESVTLLLEKLNTLKSPESLLFWMTRIYQTARTRTQKEQSEKQPPRAEDQDYDAQEPVDPIDVADLIETVLLNQQLLDAIKQRVHNNLEFVAVVRCVLRGEKPHHVAEDVGVQDYRIRVAKSRALLNLRKDASFVRLLKELAGDILPDVQGDLS